jgi:hypothetical protein
MQLNEFKKDIDEILTKFSLLKRNLEKDAHEDILKSR